MRAGLLPFIAVDANLPDFGQVKGRLGRTGGNYNASFSNRMLDTTVAFMGAK